ncbi:MAG: hypothetical protein JWQ83_1542 [Lacunisphaera sp.]|nr:hypothetical protein [Lacunisphaera sp.]
MTTSSRVPAAKPVPSKAAIRSRPLAGAGWPGFVRKGLWVLGLACAACRAAPLIESDESDTRNTSLQKLGDDELIVNEVFQSHLPQTLVKYGLRLSVNPHLGDWLHKDHMRMTTTLRYGLTDNCEISAGSNLYFSHGNGDIRALRDNGAANLKLGVKLNLGQFLFPGWETAAGCDYEFPTGHPAPELTDGLRHLRPYVTFSHRLESRPDLRIFVGFRADDITRTSLPGEFGKNAFQEDSTGITGGFVIDRENWHYTLEASWDTTRLLGQHDDDIFSLRPGVLWEIPKRRDRLVRSNWMIGVALNDTYGPGGNSLGASFKLRYSRSLKNPIHRPALTPAT